MGITLRKADGDLFINPETGRPDTITGPTKVDQELADLYLSAYDSDRQWGSSLSLSELGSVSTMNQARSILFLRLQQANDLILAKQATDPTMSDEEQIQQFSQTDVLLDTANQAIIFISVADVGTQTVAKIIAQDYKPTSLKHVIPPPTGLIPRD